MEWIKFYTGKWLYGSGRTMSADKRGVWADLLALAAETKFRDGTLRFDVGQPMPRSYIASVLRISSELLDASLEAFIHDINTDDGNPRISISEDGTIVLNNFQRYQSSPDGKTAKRLTGRELELSKRKQLNKLAAEFPQEAAGVQEVRQVIDGELKGEGINDGRS